MADKIRLCTACNTEHVKPWDNKCTVKVKDPQQQEGAANNTQEGEVRGDTGTGDLSIVLYSEILTSFKNLSE